MFAKFNPFTFRRHFPRANWWLGHHDEIVCYCPATGRVRALISHDGYGCYSSSVFVSLFEAFKLFRSGAVVSISLREFPLCIVNLPDTKYVDIYAVKSAVEDVMIGLGILDSELI